VAEAAREEQKAIERSMVGVEADVAAMQGVIERGTRLERELLTTVGEPAAASPLQASFP
jgi:hypothetical protein